MSSAEQDLYQEVIIEHKRAPRNFGTLANPTHQARGTNPQCGDDISVALRLDDQRIDDIKFTGQGCAICVASASMMTEAVRGHERELAEQLHHRLRAVITGELEPEGAELGKLVTLAGVRRYPSRIKCAMLAWHALMHALNPTAPSETDNPSEVTP